MGWVLRAEQAWGRCSVGRSVQAAFYPFSLPCCFLATNLQQYRRIGYGMGYGRPARRGMGRRWGVSPFFRGPFETCVTYEACYRGGLRWTNVLPRGDGRLSRTRREAVRIVGRVDVAIRDDTVMSRRGGGVSGCERGRFDLYFPVLCTVLAVFVLKVHAPIPRSSVAKVASDRAAGEVLFWRYVKNEARETLAMAIWCSCRGGWRVRLRPGTARCAA